jgi:flagellar basal body-associated protein FliL
MNKTWLIVLIILIVLVGGIGVYYVMNSSNYNSNATDNKNSNTAQTQLEFNAYKSGNQK